MFAPRFILPDRPFLTSHARETVNPMETLSRTHVVERGDSLQAIAHRYGTNLGELMAHNPHIRHPDRIYVGDRINLPAAQTYTVQSGDSLSAIARALGVKVADLVKANAIRNPERIYPGDRLVVPDSAPESSPSNGVDFGFISRLEGGRAVRGYVPDARGSKSGVTIATGFDLGQRSVDDLRKLGLSDVLINKLKPYLGYQGIAAERVLRRMPLTINDAQAAQIDQACKEQLLAQLAKRYDQAKATSAPRFSELPAPAQTVIASVAFQYGVNLPTRTPTFWACVTRQDWHAAYAELRDFKDSYTTRRHQEANLLATLWA